MAAVSVGAGWGGAGALLPPRDEGERKPSGRMGRCFLRSLPAQALERPEKDKVQVGSGRFSPRTPSKLRNQMPPPDPCAAHPGRVRGSLRHSYPRAYPSLSREAKPLRNQFKGTASKYQ